MGFAEGMLEIAVRAGECADRLPIAVVQRSELPKQRGVLTTHGAVLPGFLKSAVEDGK